MTLKSEGWGLRLFFKKPVKSQAISHSSVSQPQFILPPGRLSVQPLHILFISKCNCRRHPHEGSMRAEQDPAGKNRLQTPPRHCTHGHKQHHKHPHDHRVVTGEGARLHSAGTQLFLLCPGLSKAEQRWSWSCPSEE